MGEHPLGAVENYGGSETYPERIWQYDACIEAMVSLGLVEGDLILDLGSGMADLDMRLRQRGWFGRYVPQDAMIDGVDLEIWNPYPADFFVSVDFFEHLHDWRPLLQRVQAVARKGVVVATPDGDTIDVFAMHPTHFSSLKPADLEAEGLVVRRFLLGDYHQMVGFWSPHWGTTERTIPKLTS